MFIQHSFGPTKSRSKSHSTKIKGKAKTKAKLKTGAGGSSKLKLTFDIVNPKNNFMRAYLKRGPGRWRKYGPKIKRLFGSKTCKKLRKLLLGNADGAPLTESTIPGLFGPTACLAELVLALGDGGVEVASFETFEEFADALALLVSCQLSRNPWSGFDLLAG